MNTRYQALTLACVTLLATSAASADDQQAPPTRSSAEPPLEQVVIADERAKRAELRVPSLNTVGPLGPEPILDQPYSISVLPREIIQNAQATNFKDVSKYLPLVAYQEQQGPEILRPQTRGMQGGNFQNSKLDGMTMFITGATAMEQFEQIEVLNGVSASVYGPANPSGMFNFISKRPTDYALHEVTGTYISDGIGTAKVDFGGKIDRSGIFSYRLNALYASGDGYVDESHNRRTLGDLGIDVRPWQRGVIELNYTDYSLRDTGYPGWFTYGESIRLPAAPDPERVGYGQSYAGVYLRTRTAVARLKQDFSSSWHLVVGVLNQDNFRNINTPVNNLTSNNGNYTSSFASGFAPRFVITSDTAYLNGTFDTGGISHDLTFGTAGYKASSYSATTRPSAASVLLGTASIDDPATYPEPPQGPPNVWTSYDSSDAYQQGFNLADTVKFDEQWWVRVAASQDWFHTNNFNASGALTTVYRNSGVSPTGSILFKPEADITTYVTYASSLQAGDLAPGTAANAGTSLPPYRSKEYEIGYKEHFSGVDVTAALFRLERPFANIAPLTNSFRISGLQVNKGLELSAVGEVTQGLRLYGGVTLLDARLEHTPLASTNDKLYVGAPKVKGNMLLEYDIPGINGLAASFDYQFTGDRAGDDTNSFYVAGYNLFDLGLRYSTPLWGLAATWRLSVDNLTDRRYWSTVAPSNLTGANTGSLVAHLGAPRTVLAGVTVNL
jgi:iron complex outermembrane receptor protein